MYNEAEISGYGADHYISILREKFQKKLFTNKKYKPYGKIDIIEGRPMIKSEIDYIDVLTDDTYDIVSFFHVLDDMEVTAPYFSVSVDIVFHTNRITNIEELTSEIIEMLISTPFIVTDIKEGNEALENFEYEKETDQMEPFYSFKIQTNLFAQLKS